MGDSHAHNVLILGKNKVDFDKWPNIFSKTKSILRNCLHHSHSIQLQWISKQCRFDKILVTHFTNSCRLLKVAGVACQYFHQHLGIPSSHAHMRLLGFLPWLVIVLKDKLLSIKPLVWGQVWRDFPKSFGLFSACRAVFMHGHVEWETSLRTNPPPSTLKLKLCELQT